MKARFEKVPPPENGFFHLIIRDDPAFEHLWHFHPEHELTLITESRGHRIVGDHIDRYESGDLVLVGKDLPHTWCSLPGDRGRRHGAIVALFGDALVNAAHPEAAGVRPLRRLLERAGLGLAFHGRTRREVAARMRELPALSPLAQVGALWTILDKLSASREAHVLSRRPFVPAFGPGQQHPIDRVCRYLSEHHAEPLRVPALARLAGMSPGVFSRHFHRATGRTVTGYITELRLARACQLLIETERGIADVAAEAGFANLSNFNRQFLRARRARPSDYRRAARRARGA